MTARHYLMITMARTSTQRRKTAETDIVLSLDLDGSGNSTIETGIGFFDHMLTLFSRHSLIDLNVKTIGDLHIDAHHTVEDTAIVLGDALREALGSKEGITRYGHAYLPMDETLARVVIDLSNRPHLEFRTSPHTASAPNFPLTLTEEFCRALASNLRCNLHVELLYGRDGHHIAEAIFKGIARALRTAITVDPRVKGVPSTKEAL
jgi:imidazoleglycerol-phosphate dehydratase